MPFKQAKDIHNIQEMEYGTGKEIKFSPFDSCIGLIGKSGSEVTGVHLVLFSSEGMIDAKTAELAVHQLGSCTQLAIVGLTDIWRDTAEDAWGVLKTAVATGTIVRTGKGTFAARVSDSALQYHDGATWKDL